MCESCNFNQYFTSQCTQPPGAENHPLPPFEYETHARLSDMSFSIPEVKKILKSLNVNKATGPDGIRNVLLKIPQMFWLSHFEFFLIILHKLACFSVEN